MVSFPEIEEPEGRAGFVGHDGFGCVELKTHMGDPTSAIWWVDTCDRSSPRCPGRSQPSERRGYVVKCKGATDRTLGMYLSNGSMQSLAGK